MDTNEFTNYQPQEQVATIPSRLIVVESVYHQLDGDQPVASDTRFSRDLETNEQRYVRNFTVTEEWQPLETGWLQECSMMLLSNNAPRYTNIPTEEVKYRDYSRVVELGIAEQDEPTEHVIVRSIIHVGESIRDMPSDLSSLRIRSRVDGARCTLIMIPR